VSYVDDAGIVVAADSQDMVRGELERVFDECTVVAKGRGMDFSTLKRKWIGFGEEVWGPCRLGGVQVSGVSDLRVLGMRFACDGSMLNHVDYWLQRGLEVWGRIGALARRFGGEGGIGAWEVMRLVQGAYLLMVEYGLEFVADDLVAIKKIEVHVRDCLRSLFRMPLRLANNILHSVCGILPPTPIRAAYYRARFAQRFLNYRYCDDLPWHGSIRQAWCLPGMKAVRMESHEVLSGTQRFHIPADKQTGLTEGQRTIDSLAHSATMVGFVDGSNRGTGCGCAWIAFRGSVELRKGSAGLPLDWDINSCELFAILSLLRDILALSPRDVLVLSDSQVAVKALRDMECSGTSSGIWQAFAPLMSQIPNLIIRWIPGHMGILGNEITDRLAKMACELALEPGRFQDVDFGFGCYAPVRERRLAQWRFWHTEQGHVYYQGTPRDFKHLRRLTRLDLFAIIRIRSGTGMVGHEECHDSDERHHWTTCDRYADGRPASNTLYDNSKIGIWVDWIRKHDVLGLGIPSNTRRCGNINVAFGNPFDGTACIIYDGRRIVVDVAPPTLRCNDCNLCHSSAGCPLPALKMAHSYYFVAPGATSCPVCLARITDSKAGRSRHFSRSLTCTDTGCRRFWSGVKLLWERFDPAEKVKLAVKWLYPVHSRELVTCCGCQNVFGGSDKWLSHLRLAKSDGCWPSLWIKFLTDCDAEGDDDAAKLLILSILGRVETV